MVLAEYKQIKEEHENLNRKIEALEKNKNSFHLSAEETKADPVYGQLKSAAVLAGQNFGKGFHRGSIHETNYFSQPPIKNTGLEVALVSISEED